MDFKNFFKDHNLDLKDQKPNNGLFLDKFFKDGSFMDLEIQNHRFLEIFHKDENLDLKDQKSD